LAFDELHPADLIFALTRAPGRQQRCLDGIVVVHDASCDSFERWYPRLRRFINPNIQSLGVTHRSLVRSILCRGFVRCGSLVAIDDEDMASIESVSLPEDDVARTQVDVQHPSIFEQSYD